MCVDTDGRCGMNAVVEMEGRGEEQSQGSRVDGWLAVSRRAGLDLLARLISPTMVHQTRLCGEREKMKQSWR